MSCIELPMIIDEHILKQSFQTTDKNNFKHHTRVPQWRLVPGKKRTLPWLSRQELNSPKLQDWLRRECLCIRCSARLWHFLWRHPQSLWLETGRQTEATNISSPFCRLLLLHSTRWYQLITMLFIDKGVPELYMCQSTERNQLMHRVKSEQPVDHRVMFVYREVVRTLIKK